MIEDWPFLVPRDLYLWPFDPKINGSPGLKVEHFCVKFGEFSCISFWYIVRKSRQTQTLLKTLRQRLTSAWVINRNISSRNSHGHSFRKLRGSGINRLCFTQKRKDVLSNQHKHTPVYRSCSRWTSITGINLEQVCRSSLLSGWMYADRVTCCPLVSHGEYANGTDRQIDRRTDARPLNYVFLQMRPV